MLNEKQLRALAREARKLASDIADGRGPEFTPWTWCGCAAGTVVANTGLVRPDSTEHDRLACQLAFATEVPLSAATVEEDRHHNGALVFPLLWWADDLEELAAQPPPEKSP